MTVLVQAVAGVVIFEADSGKRIAASYFDALLKERDSQIALEKELIVKAGKSSVALAEVGMVVGDVGKEDAKRVVTTHVDVNEVVLVDRYIVLLRLVNDVLIAVIADESQNDLLMSEYLNTLHGCLSEITSGNVLKKKLFDRLDQVFLIIDESLEKSGTIFETDPHVIVARIGMHESVVVEGAPTRPPIASAVREGFAAISRGDTDSLRSVFAGAAQSFGNFLGR